MYHFEFCSEMVIINNLPSIVSNDNWNPRPDKINPNISGMTGENDGSTLPRLSVGSYKLLVKLRLPTYFLSPKICCGRSSRLCILISHEK